MKMDGLFTNLSILCIVNSNLNAFPKASPFLDLNLDVTWTCRQLSFLVVSSACYS